MKKFMYLFLAVIISAAVVSCGNKTKKEDEKEAAKAENFADLKVKYDGKTFKDCDEFFTAGEEMIDVMVITAKKIEKGDEKAKTELLEMMTWMEQFNIEAEKHEAECPDKMAEFNKKVGEKTKPIENTLMMLAFESMGADNTDLSEKIEGVSDEVDNKLESLKSDNSDALNKLKNK